MTVTAMPKNEEGTAKRRPVRLIAFVAVLIIAAAAGWFLVLAPSDSKETGPKPGAVEKLDAMQINLAAGHYLRLGLALQLTEDVGEEAPDGSKALDAAISLFTGLSVEELAQHGKRDLLKEQLVDRLHELYHGEVMGVYFTEFVTQ